MILRKHDYSIATIQPNTPLRLLTISSEFVISQNENGDTLSIFSDNTWNLECYITSIKSPKYFNFHKIKAEEQLISQTKELLLVLWNTLTGNNGINISITSLYNYFLLLWDMAEYCHNLSIDMYNLIHSEVELDKFTQTLTHGNLKKLKPFLRAIYRTTQYNIENKAPASSLTPITRAIRSSKKDTNQHPVIPPHILLEKITNYRKVVDDYFQHEEKLNIFSVKISQDMSYGRSETQQHLNDAENHRPNFREATFNYGLDDLFKQYYITNVSKLSGYYSLVQYSSKMLMHIFSGMRDSEAYSMMQNSFSIVDGTHGRIARILSVTTKLTGEKTPVNWVTSVEIEAPYSAALSIAKLITKINGWTPSEKNPLFISCSHFPFSNGYKRYNLENTKKIIIANLAPITYDHLLPPSIINKDDLRHLSNIDPHREWYADPEFAIGNTWPTTTHQFRRSLCVYALQSGLVNLSSLKVALHHIRIEMTMYYSRGFSNASWLLDTPKDHIKNDFTDEQSLWESRAYTSNVLDNGTAIYGAQAANTQADIDNFIIYRDRSETAKNFRNGLIFYRETALGGCMSRSGCALRAHVVVTACINCKDGLIQHSKMDSLIEEQQNFVDQLEPNTMEYVTEVEQLNDFKRMRMEIIS
ncbi:hypothetical protein JFU49_16605 [Pseudomonas sp. TH03]|uniref:hypothetical protein n=1 Tax=Pseudomonas sp. TH03 TaxID=2796369 RepID=UPI001913CEA2|nr:hypothetical protein [Pseudomonas sp. TH03]MBK5551882.1 hypothetical protein [Pseudomonas sp. TH03]